ncbi:hypothetical protein CLV98_12335 [Dyadobacter jejuensis]|uniref:Uncharacterized protein n=1 Tax=Dyadobacter jejuensis TaxID=1082580 RepID=A0A316A6C5_9BACT|nr:hypothetical protein [Dyadobacter jejuensis]PWJ53421.1 hypothetical protein CLV98_12335 [Dyadobacter jejuensis]
MIVYLVHIKKYKIQKNQQSRRFYPVDSIPKNANILVETKNTFPDAFVYWNIRPTDFLNKSKVFCFKNIKMMFEFFVSNEVEVGTTLSSFYKIKKEVPEETSFEGALIYSYKNINIFALRII